MRAAHPPSCVTVLTESSTVTVGPHLASSGALGAPGTIAVLTASGTEILPPNGGLATKSALKLSASLSPSQRCFRKFHPHWVKLIWRCFPAMCLEKMLWMVLEKGAAAGTWVHRGRGHLCQVPQCLSEHSQPYRQVAAACLVVFAGGSTSTHPAKKHPDPVQYLGILQGTALEQYFYTEFLIKVITFAILESMTNYIPSREAITWEGPLVSCLVQVLNHGMGERYFVVSNFLHGFQDVTCN